MKTKRQPVLRRLVCVAVLLVMMGCVQQHARPRTEPLTAQDPRVQPVPDTAAAEVILMRMAEFLANTPRFSVNLSDNYDVLQKSGQKIEFGEIRSITVSRPNGLRVEIEHSNGEQHYVQYDGNDITTFSPTHHVYAQVSKPGGIDVAVLYFLRDLNMRLPLAMLLVSRLPEELKRRTQALEYVEKTNIHGIPSHHLAGRTETVDYQVWIATGTQPVPLRVVLTYKNEVGQPQFRARFSDWNLNPEIDDTLFTFVPPEGMTKIAFLAELPRIAFEGKTNPRQTGEQQ